ncbi:MAG: tetratricopeptide repeat protein [Deltaproteobacteria bacterium]|nr:tetratricopeptide repeat protein [Deltaproteobacteria bacterium]
MKQRSLIAFLILSAIAVIIYSNTFSSPFIFDDGMYIIRNPLIKNMGNFWPPSGPRYLGYLSFAINFYSGGLDTTGYHVVNLFIHIINGCLVYLLVAATFKTPWMAKAGMKDACSTGFILGLITSILFIAHPVQTQAVTYTTQRFASLATLFYLLSLVLYVKWRAADEGGGFKKTVFYVAALASAIAAENTKEISFTLPFAVVLYELAFFDGPFKKRALPLIPFLITLVIIPLTILGPEMGIGGGGVDIGERTRELQIRDLTALSRHDYLVTQFRVIITYLRLLVLPVNQNLDYDYPLLRSIFTPEALLSFLFLLALFAGAVYLFFLSRKKACPLGLLTGAGIIWFFMTISIESSIIPINDLIFEHRLYLPSIGAALAFGGVSLYGINLLREKAGIKASAAALAGGLIVATALPLGAATYLRNNVWGDEITFWEDAIRKSPGKARVHNNLGSVYYKRGETGKAMDEFKAAVRLKPNFADAHYNLAIAYKDMGLMDAAITELEDAVRFQPGKANAHNNLGLAYLSKGRIMESIEEFNITLRLQPENYRAHNNLGLAYKSLGRLDEAAFEFRTALSISPGFEDAYNNLQYMNRREEK